MTIVDTRRDLVRTSFVSAQACALIMCLVTVVQAERLVLYGGAVVDPEADQASGPQAILVEDGTIVGLLPSEDYRPRSADRVVDCRGRYVIPGLCDAYAHIEDPYDLLVLVAHGVTVIRHMDGSPNAMDLRRRVKRGELVGPMMVVASPEIRVGEPRTLVGPRNISREGGPTEARRVVRDYVRRGFDGITIGANLPRELYDAILDEASKSGSPVWGPVPHTVGLSKALRKQSGVDLVDATWRRPLLAKQSSAGSSEEETVRLARIAHEHRTALVPLMIRRAARGFGSAQMGAQPSGLVSRTQWEAQALLQQRFWLRALEGRNDWLARATPNRSVIDSVVREFDRAGAYVLAGSAYGAGGLLVPGHSLLSEVEELARAGLRSSRALRAATLSPAEFLGLAEMRGRVEAGRSADFVILDENPLKRIDAIRDIYGVVLRGAYLSRRKLDGMLADVRRAQADYAPFRGCQPLPKSRDAVWQGEFLVRESEEWRRTIYAVVGGERVMIDRGNGRLRAVAQRAGSSSSRVFMEIDATLDDDWKVEEVSLHYGSKWGVVRARGRRTATALVFEVTAEGDKRQARTVPLKRDESIHLPGILGFLVAQKRHALLESGSPTTLTGPAINIDWNGRVLAGRLSVRVRRVSDPLAVALLRTHGATSGLRVTQGPEGKEDGQDEHLLVGLDSDGWPAFVGASDKISELTNRFSYQLERR